VRTDVGQGAGPIGSLVAPGDGRLRVAAVVGSLDDARI
jgi:hypothetical protein